MEDNNKVSQKEFENVSGGWEDQTNEIKEFIRKHDPDYKIYNNFDVNRWLMEESGLGLKSVATGDSWFNEYNLAGGGYLSHDELMQKLREKFGDLSVSQYQRSINVSRCCPSISEEAFFSEIRQGKSDSDVTVHA